MHFRGAYSRIQVQTTALIKPHFALIVAEVNKKALSKMPSHQKMNKEQFK